MNRYQAQQLIILALLVAIGLAGRWGRPEWGFTPLAAVGLFAGRYFANRWLALAVPALVLAVSNLAEPAHTSLGVMLTVVAAATLPVVLGRMMQPKAAAGRSLAKRSAQWALCVLTPSLVFFLTTNSAVWLFEGFYAKTAAGLVECLAAGVPFYRSMLVGDLFYAATLFGAAYLAGVAWPQRRPAPVGDARL